GAAAGTGPTRPADAFASSGAAADQAAATPGGTDQSRRDRADADACGAALLNGPARGGRMIGSGTGTFRDRPAVVAVFELDGATVAFVTDRTGCAVLDRFTV
ncbi:MAG TPA: hypothetical protein VHL53_12375, partial [Acidimicrobiia bacterium]|nr:hypothetical protein [Acidimicrobiia bacterium]